MYLFRILSAFLLIGCGDDKASEETAKLSQVPETTEQENIEEVSDNAEHTEENKTVSEELISKDANQEDNKTETVITTEKAEEVVENLVEAAQDDEIIQNIKIDESKDKIIANIELNEDTSDQERGTFYSTICCF